MLSILSLFIIVVHIGNIFGQNAFDVVSPGAHFYPIGPEDAEDTFAVAPINDDGSTGPLPISTAFPFLNNLYNHIYISTNGVISFLRDIQQFIPENFPLGEDSQVIAPFWSDVDTTQNGGRIYYREYQSGNVIRGRIYQEILTQFSEEFIPDWVLTVTWFRVTCSTGCMAGEENTFQAILTTDGVKSFISFRYGDMTWGDLPGYHAIIGYTSPSGYYQSNFTTAADKTDTSWNWTRVDRNTDPSGCSYETSGTILVRPGYSNALGGKRVTISGPCFNTTDILCRFGELTVSCIRITNAIATCITPLMGDIGTYPLTCSLDGGNDNFPFRTTFIYVKYDPENAVTRSRQATGCEQGDGWEGYGIPPPRLSWTRFDNTMVDITYVQFSLHDNGSVITTEIPIEKNVSGINGPGYYHRGIPNDLETAGFLPFPLPGAIKITPTTASSHSVEQLWTDIHNSGWYVRRYIRNVVAYCVQTEGCIGTEYTEVWNKISSFFENGNQDFNDDAFDNITAAIFSPKCNDWRATDISEMTDLSVLPAPPCTIRQARNDPDFYELFNDESCADGVGCAFCEDASHCIRSRTPSLSGAAQVACYNESGGILTYDAGGGAANKVGIETWFNRDALTMTTTPAGSIIGHVWHDVRPLYYCCRWSDNCDIYKAQRPTQDCVTPPYMVPGVGTGFGDPHVVTLDGYEYTFNGLGEYILLHIPSVDFTVQARTGRTRDINGELLDATEWSALAMKMSSFSTVQVEVNDFTGLDVYIDGTIQRFDDVAAEINFNGGAVSRSTVDNSTVVKVTYPGAIFEIRAESSTRLSFFTRLSNNLKGNSEGLLGVWNDNSTDDLLTASGETLSGDSNEETIFHQFGESWRITQSKSLFLYSAGETYSTFNDPTFVPMFITDDMISDEARTICGENRQCLFDFTATGDRDFALSTMQTVDVLQQILSDIVPVLTCGFPPPPANGTVQGSSGSVGSVFLFMCSEGFTLLGSESITCEAGGNWSAPFPVCGVTVEVSVGGEDDDTMEIMLITIGSASSGILLMVLILLGITTFSGRASMIRFEQVQRLQYMRRFGNSGAYYKHFNTNMPRTNTGFLRPLGGRTY